MCLACFALTLMIFTLALPQSGGCRAELVILIGCRSFIALALQPWLGLWDPAVHGEDLVLAAHVVPLAVPLGSSWLDFEDLAPAVGFVCLTLVSHWSL